MRMLLRAAARTANGRAGAASLRVARSQAWARSYAKDDRPRRGQPKPSPFADNPISKSGPIRNETWSPPQGVRFAPKKTARRDGSQAESAVEIPEEVEQAAERQRVRAAHGAPPDPFVQSQPPNVEPAVHEADPIAEDNSQHPPQPTRPLPDLRQGIPSTFDAEYSDRSSSFKDQDSRPPSLNLTEDPADPRGDRKGEGQSNKEEYISSIERRRQQTARYLYILAAAFLTSSAVILGRNWEESDARLYPEAPNGWSPTNFWARIKARLGAQLGYYTEPVAPKLLPAQPADPQYRLPTLVVSLEDLLVKSTWTRQEGYKVAKRPGVDYFLRYLSQYYEIVIFTTVQSMNADLIINKLDPYHIALPLFREATRYVNGEHVKDLSYLDRPLSKVVVVDTVASHVQFQPENAIVLPKWDGSRTSPEANDLVGLVDFLEYIANVPTETDLRKHVASYAGTHIPSEFRAREARARAAFEARLADEDRARPRRAGLGGLAASLGFKPAAPVQLVGGQAVDAGGAGAGRKMWSDQVREYGRRNFADVNRDFEVNGPKYLEEMEREQKKMQDEMTKSMQGNVAGFFGGILGGGGGSGGPQDGTASSPEAKK